MQNKYNGLLNIYKEPGFTSNDVVAKLRGILHQRKIGHTGTLDPDAVGVLVVCVGNATKLCQTLTDHDKEYIAVCRLGVTTDTQDMSGNVLNTADVDVTHEQLAEAVSKFVGEYDQIPPMYSAIKVGGKKLYELAREGITVERKPRHIKISAIKILDDSHLLDEHVFTMQIECSKGTYIRTLCNDIGESLGCGAAMEHLTRTRVGNYSLETAMPLSQVEQKRDDGTLMECISSTESFFRDLDIVHIKDECRRLVENGNTFKIKDIIDESPSDAQDNANLAEFFADGDRVRVYGSDGTFFGVYHFEKRIESFRVDLFFYEKETQNCNNKLHTFAPHHTCGVKS